MFEKALFFGKVDNDYFDSPCKLLNVSHAEGKPLQARLTIGVRSHEYVELLFVDPADMVAVRTLEVCIKVNHLVVHLQLVSFFLLLSVFGKIHPLTYLTPAYLTPRFLLLLKQPDLHRPDFAHAQRQ